MNKKTRIAIVLLCALCLLLLPGCQKDEGSEQSVDSPQESASVNSLSKNSLSIDNSSYDICPRVGIGPIQFGMSGEDVVKHLGEPEKVMNEGRSLMYPSKGFTLMVSPKRGVQIVNCYTKLAVPSDLSAKDFQGMTTEGIAMGASQSQIKAVYGKPDSEADLGSQTELNYSELGIRFILLNDGLVQLFMNVP